VRARLRIALGLGMAVVSAAPAPSQQATQQATSTRRCPVLGGIRISVTGIDTAGAPRFTLDTRTTLDTTFVLDITERRWREPLLTASLEAGIGDTTRARWHACTGVAISMRDVTLSLHDVHGQVHYKVDLTPLRNIRRLGAGAPPRR
jgi:hypothetical protein